MNEPTTYLNPEDRQRLASFVFRPRGAVEGVMAGRHTSRHTQRSGIEFVDTRPYLPGDEVSDIDWKAYGRTDRLYVRLFERETDLTVGCLVDASASMSYDGGTGPSKFQHACRLAASVASLVASQQDRVAFGAAQNQLVGYLPPSAAPGQPEAVAEQMMRLKPKGQTRMAESVRQFAAQVGRQMVLVLFSDLLCEVEPLVAALDLLAGRQGEVIVFQTLHSDELQAPEGQEAVMVDPESGQKLSVHLDDVRADYQHRVQAFVDQWARVFRSRQIDHRLTRVGEDPVDVLKAYLIQRAGSA